MINKTLNKQKRKTRIRKMIIGTKERPRLVVFRSNKHIEAQIIDDTLSKTLVSSNDREIKKSAKKTDIAFEVGMLIADKAKKSNIKNVVFDRGGHIYHGRVKLLADGARRNGLIF